MFDIAKYLEKFTVLSNSRHFSRDSVCDAVKEICGVTLNPKDVEVKESVARIKEKPIFKNEIFLKKAKIISFLKEKKNINIVDIL